MKTSIALIGFMGTGKSTVARVLSQKLGKEYVEVDTLIENRAGKSISQIFREDGESTFRKLEIEAIKEISKRRNQVISCGGGVVLNNLNIDNLKQDSIVIWLTASPETIAKRTGLNGEERPLLNKVKSIEDLQVMIKSRELLYQKVGDMKVDTSNLGIYNIVDYIILQLKENADFNTKK
jgi:shikimate kinase